MQKYYDDTELRIRLIEMFEMLNDICLYNEALTALLITKGIFTENDISATLNYVKSMPENKHLSDSIKKELFVLENRKNVGDEIYNAVKSNNVDALRKIYENITNKGAAN